MKAVTLPLAVLLLPLFLCSAHAADKLGVALPYSVESVDPLALREPVNRLVLANISSPLVSLAADGSVNLEAARELRSTATGKKWHVVLRSEARFPSLRLVTPEDVRRSFEWLNSRLPAAQNGPARASLAPACSAAAGCPDSPFAPFAAAGLANVEAIELRRAAAASRYSLGATEIVFSLRSASADFPRLLSCIPIVDVEVASVFARDAGMGTNGAFLGPYQLRENRPGRGILLEHTSEFYRPGRPIASILDLHVYGDADSALRALRVGGVDIIALPTAAQRAEAQDDPTLSVLPSPFLRLSAATGPWVLKNTFWSRTDDQTDRLLTDSIIVRKSLHLDEAAHARFDLSGTYLP